MNALDCEKKKKTYIFFTFLLIFEFSLNYNCARYMKFLYSILHLFIVLGNICRYIRFRYDEVEYVKPPIPEPLNAVHQVHLHHPNYVQELDRL